MERFTQCLGPQAAVELELIRRHEERSARRVEIARATVCRQAAHIDLHSQQVADRIGILAPVQPPHRDHALRIIQSTPRRHHHLRKVFKQISLRILGRLFLILRRHLTRIDRIEHLLPLLSRLDGRDRERHVIHAKLPLLLLSAVAGNAVLFEKSAVPFRHHRVIHRTRLGRGDGVDSSNQENETEQAHGYSYAMAGRILIPAGWTKGAVSCRYLTRDLS